MPRRHEGCWEGAQRVLGKYGGGEEGGDDAGKALGTPTFTLWEGRAARD